MEMEENSNKPGFSELEISQPPPKPGISPAEDPFRGEGTPENRTLVRKIDCRILPLSAGIYLLCYLDRSNIGNAKILNEDEGNDLLQETHMTSYQYTIALMVFLIAYGLFEVPSNYFLKRMRPNRWIAFLMLSWGALTMGIGGVQNFAGVTAVRFLLGVFEAGLFPGLVYYLTFWYRPNERSIRVALILASATLAGAFGGAIAYGVGHMNQVSGLSAWRWLFILEGLPSCLSAILVWFFLPSYPERASWLDLDEKSLAWDRLEHNGSREEGSNLTWAEARDILKQSRLWIHYLIYFGISVPFSSLSLFSPTVVAGLGFSSLRANLMTVPPYAVAYVVTVLVSWSADHFNARALHSAVFSLIGAVAFLVQAILPADAYTHRYGCLIVATSGAFSCIPPLLGWLSTNTRSTAAAGLVIALNVSWGAPGQIVGVWIYKANEKAIGYPTGHYTNAALLFFIEALVNLNSLDLNEFVVIDSRAFATALLHADSRRFGIEHPTRGDDTRAWGPPFAKNIRGKKVETPGESAYFLAVNRNKKSLGLSFADKRGVSILHELARTSDVLVENYIPGALAKYKMDYETLSKINPRLIYASITGYGQTGPYSKRAGYDVMVEAEMGLMHITGSRDGPPVKVGVAVTDLTTGLYTSNAIMAALLGRIKSGKGQWIDAALSDCQVATLANLGSSALISGEKDTGRWGTAHPSIVPYKAFKTKDGDVLLGGGNDRLFGVMCDRLGKPKWKADERFVTNSVRVENRDILESMVESVTSTKTTKEWLDILEGSGMPYAAVNDIQGTLHHEHVLARDMVKEVEHPTCGPMKLLNTPVKYSHSTPGIRTPPPTLGQHTDDVLTDLGMGVDEIEGLKRDGVVA
ncbi:MAG: hypothetical protein M1834_008023 [Cirrosporium novae-zelandiae]|nr:MAG: hypothetical protein M1834_008023 [Cirrosporium novae-zelandiae]